MSNTKKHNTYFTNLDGLRALAALAVVAFHCVNGFDFTTDNLNNHIGAVLSFNQMGGTYGVAFFFILSGFLITYLIYREEQKTGRLHILFFYMRRLLRIWPLYYLTLLIGFVLYPLAMAYFGNGYEEVASAWMYIFFLANFDIILNQESASVGILGVHWSLAVEEQFYLFWPIVFSVFKKQNHLWVVFSCLFVLSEVFYWSNDNGYVLYYHLITNLRFLVFGAILAYFSFYKLEYVKRIVDFGGILLKGLIYVMSLIGLFFAEFLKLELGLSIPLHFLPIVFFSYVIAEQCFSSNKLIAIGRSRILSEIGKISYGVYLFHIIVIYGILNLFGETDPYFIKLIGTFIITIFVAYIVYHFYETPFLRWKKRFTV